ncbi:26S proteasome non-ATPase regulatory subunit 10 [Kwoniella mangroviensis CBS 10435]|uniref:26S proteasome non-ATPase regulatory subunit 10 n=1 Tax=Kwoniella mangroviensis CBS 10435 TaxID=1331196 RepID=A0A1B9IW21_9TREE|nr:26S proteasome non-ATPase regulatory subunit 10 [Kwoniella mangroviensis CBS 8507]OCF59723.1 26S proteasome non-ATPase regulatory subunit 10 [Kwoniella mangroviensis CBS 10435]OCF66116.1 26S proteasome non-ATPase regulatory subunit 10 [Kwoniella mangroviensis CBS 8507]OCF71244.1 26S proteasome non-ATPase regulatory subunit 10 [Kwoniella mangroviensis CBS 8886]
MSSFSIHKAALEGQPGLIRSLLSEDPKLVNSKDEDGRTPLHWASTTGNLNVLQLILSYHPELESRDSMGWTALIIASASNQVEVVRELLEAGAQVDAINEKGQTALHYAASKGNVSIGRLLISRGADANRASQFPLHRAATTGNHAFLSLLLNPPEGRPKTRLNGADRAGNTPLHLAFESGHGDAAVTLIEAGADRERSNSEGQVPEEIEGVGGQEQKNVRNYVISKVGPRRE